MNDMDTRHNFGPVTEVDNGHHGVLLVQECLDCKATVGGDKDIDLVDVDEWAGECKPIAAANAALIFNSPGRRGILPETLTYSPFAGLKGVFS